MEIIFIFHPLLIPLAWHFFYLIKDIFQTTMHACMHAPLCGGLSSESAWHAANWYLALENCINCESFSWLIQLKNVFPNTATVF